MFRFLSRFRYFDVPLIFATFLLTFAGLAILYGTTLSETSNAIFYRQLVFFAIGIAGFLFVSFFDYHALAKANRVIYVVIVLLLFYLPLFSGAVKGGKRWLSVAAISFQPAEFTKLIVVLGLARLLYFKRGQINSWKTIIWSFFYAFMPAALVILEPDLGSAIIIMSIWAGVILLSPIKKKFLAVIFLIFLASAGIGWKFLLKDFQRDRVRVFLNPGLDPKGRGYNVQQATIAVGSGQFFGTGLGKGVEGQSKFLPERQTDFIFSASSEEIGFVGSFSLLGLYFFLLVRILKIMRKAKDDLGMYIAGGVFFLFFFQILINVGMNIGLLPVTGIPLPFVSSGGSSLVVSLLALGVLQNISQQSKVLRF